MASGVAGGGEGSWFFMWKEKGLDQACEHMVHTIRGASQFHLLPDVNVLFLLKSDN